GGFSEVMSNPASVGICLVRSQGFRRAERFAGAGTFFAFWGDLGQSRTAPKSSDYGYIERPHQSLEPTAGRSDDQFTTLLRSPTAQRSSRCRSDFHCAAIRSAVVWRAKRRRRLRKVFQPFI